MLAGVLALSFPVPPAAAATVGYRDFSMTGAVSPTAEKPQSKLWFNDGLWWGSLFNSATTKFDIYRFSFSTNTWTDTGTVIDGRNRSSADALWNGSHLYVASAVPPGTSPSDTSIKFLRYSYNSSTKAYSLDTGFPVIVASLNVEAVVIDKDTTGEIWLTYTAPNTSGGRNVYITHTTTSDTTFLTPFVLPAAGADNLTSDDISTLIAYSGQIGVMWSNQNDDVMYFASHVDGDPDTTWTENPAVQGPKYAEDHINLKSLQADSSGEVFAAVKTSLDALNPVDPNAPLILLLVLKNGSWTRHTFGRVQDNHTRPIVLLNPQNRQLYMFATSPCCLGGTIYLKQSSLDNISFPTGLGTPFIQSDTDTHINNATSTKQALTNASGLLVEAADDQTHFYLHNTISFTPGAFFSDDFEGGNFSKWTSVVTGGDGTAQVLAGIGTGGSLGAQLKATSNAGSQAFVQKTLASAQTNISFSADVRFVSQGSSSVRILSLRSSSGSTIASIKRAPNGSLKVSYGGTTFRTTGSLALNAAYSRLTLHVIAAGAGASTVEVLLNNTSIYRTTMATIPATSQVLQVADNGTRHAYVLQVDNVLAQSGA